MKIVLIAQNCYPSLGPRAHRTTELAKEFARRGHKVIVYALLGDYNYSEYSDSTGIVFKNLGKSKLGMVDNSGNFNPNLIYRAIIRLFGKYLELPFIELIPMVKRALKNEGDIDFLISIAQPHTIHWGVSEYLKKNRNKINFWVADCGDPFMKDPFNSRPFYFNYFEKQWGRLCNYISIPVQEASDAYYPEFKNKLKIIPQGFGFEEAEIANYVPNEVPTFAYSGFLYKGKRDMTKFLEYLLQKNEKFKFIVYTPSAPLFEHFKDKFGSKLEIRDYVPRRDLLFELSKMDFLINIANQSTVQVPSKLIDYALTNRPILEITSDFSQVNEFREFLNGDFSSRKEITNIWQYDIRNVADAFLKLK